MRSAIWALRKGRGIDMEQKNEMGRDNHAVLRVMEEVGKVVRGKEACIRKVFSAILAGGHILIEDVPGVGKTTLALAFSRVLALESHRVQFTPDVLPADILGFSMYDKAAGTFIYHPGTVMCNIFLADEINRTSPKTQSALLEVMEEGMVTVDGISHPVPKPFIVMATQNPRGSAGTQLLPESQLDRFMVCMSMGYPDEKSEIEIARGRSSGSSYDQIEQVLDVEGLRYLRQAVEEIFVHDTIYRYMLKLVSATRENDYIELGVSPRGTIALTRMAKAEAFLSGRSYVIPEDVETVFLDVTKHRILLNTKARVTHVSGEAVLKKILADTVKPTVYREKSGDKREKRVQERGNT